MSGARFWFKWQMKGSSSAVQTWVRHWTLDSLLLASWVACISTGSLLWIPPQSLGLPLWALISKFLKIRLVNVHVWMNLDHVCVVSWITVALVPDQMDELQMRTSPLLAYFGQHCENSQGCTLMPAPPHDTVYPTKAWPHLLFELWCGTFIHISDETFLPKLASLSTVPLQMLPVCGPS